MKICLSAAQLFLRYLAGEIAATEVLAHPAYRAVNAHCQLLQGQTLSTADLAAAVRGERSPFFGLEQIRERLPELEQLMALIQEHQAEWELLVDDAVRQLAPAASLDFPAYPIFGYDVGIGIERTVAMNINWPWYFTEPREFLSLLVHECTHAVSVPRLRPVKALETLADWEDFFALLVQQEGYAVYAPMALREQLGLVPDESNPIARDYAVLADPERVRQHITMFDAMLGELRINEPSSTQEYLSRLFNADRLTYRVGCTIVRRVAEVYGQTALQEGLCMPGREFLSSYRSLLEL